MNTRLKQFLAAENISQSQFADTINVVRASVSHVLSGRNKPGYDFITAIMSAYPHLNIEWLMLGRGKMYRSQQEPVEVQQRPAPQTYSEDLPLLFDYPEDLPEAEIAPAPVHVNQNMPAPSSMETSNNNTQPIVKQRKATKIVVFFDDEGLCFSYGKSPFLCVADNVTAEYEVIGNVHDGGAYD